ncbi:MAG: trypsin-like peptidase domain-containing protein [Lachnospiraceae bacterium]|nr:trypsin-like peptidase domain-containing protein [Lachnospiraceae bacterium]
MKYLKYILILIVCALFLSGCSSSDSVFDVMKNDMEKQKSMNICIISATENDSSRSYSAGASGVIVDKDEDGYYALTAAHVVDKKNSKFLIMTVLDPTLSEYRKEHQISLSEVSKYYDTLSEGEVIYTNPSEDMAIIYFVSDKDLAIADFSKNYPKKGDPIITVGSYSEQLDYFYVTTGKIKSDELTTFSTNDQYKDNQVLQHSAFTAEGFSGGGVYDADMKLVGMNIGGGTDVFGRFKYSAMIPCERLKKCIDESGIEYSE